MGAHLAFGVAALIVSIAAVKVEMWTVDA